MFTFFREDSIWPYVHCLINGSLYYNVRSWRLSLLLMYIWETLEYAVVSQFSDKFSEAKDDSLVGDPIVGFLIITALFIADVILGGKTAFIRTVPAYIRFLCFVTHGIMATVVGFFNSNSGWPILLVGVLFVAIALAFYGSFIFPRQADVVFERARLITKRHLTQFLYFVVVLTLLVAPRPFHPERFPFNSWMRVVLAETTYLGAMSIAYVMIRPTTGA